MLPAHLQQAAVMVGLAVLVVELLRGRRAPATVFGGLAMVFILLDLSTVSKAMASFTNPGLVAVVLLLLISVVLDKSHLLELVAEKLLSGSYRWALAKLYVTTAAYSAFLNNTAVVASLIGPLRTLRSHPASRLLMPMCFAASLGGVMTLVGTSTNLLVNSLGIGQGLPPLEIFDLFPVGALLVFFCGITMVVLYPWLLKVKPAQEETASDYFLEARVRPGSALEGRSVEEAGLRKLSHLFLAELVRDGRVLVPVQPDDVLQAGDVLVFTGDLTRLDLLTRIPGLETHGQHFKLPTDNLVEVVVSSTSTLIKRTIKDVDFRSRFDAAVIAVRRGSERLKGPIAQIPLEVGDTLVLCVGKDFEKHNNVQRNFVVVSERQVQKFTNPRSGLLAMGAFVGAVLLSALGVVEFLKALLVLLVAFLVLGFAKPGDLRRNMPYGTMIIIASSLVISDVMVSSGAAKVMAAFLMGGVESFGPYASLAVLLVVTWLLTELMSNNAAAALAFPVALGAAQASNLDPQPFVMAVLYGASCSFLTPYGYQTNLMIMSPGRYTMGDYVRTGGPVAAVYLVVAAVSIPVFFPFR
jgi:di/tricarboxylate transporter